MNTKEEYGSYPTFLGGHRAEEEREKAIRGFYLKLERIALTDTHEPTLINLLKEL